MLNLKRCCEILEIRPDTSPEEAKLAFRDLVSIWHPDKYCHNPRLMEKADRKLREINGAWQQLQAFYQEQERAGLERRNERAVAKRHRAESDNGPREQAELRPADLDIDSIITPDYVRQAYRDPRSGLHLYDPDPGLMRQEEEIVPDFQGAEGRRSRGDTGGEVRPGNRGQAAGEDPMYEDCTVRVHPNPDEHDSRADRHHRVKTQEKQETVCNGHDSRKRTVQFPAAPARDGADQPPTGSETEISRKMKLLYEYYVQGRMENKIRQRQEVEKTRKELEEEEEKVRSEQKQKHSLLMERYLERYNTWLSDEKVKYDLIGHDKEQRTGINRLFHRKAKEKEFLYGIPNIRMMFITGGMFAMGRDDSSSLYRKILGHESSHPRHTVSVRDFYISKYPVTVRQWSRAMGVKTSEDGHHLPVLLNWDDVQTFIARLNGITGLRFRLPTEAEWEYAARSGGKDEKWPEESSGSSICTYASADRGYVGHHKPNMLGLYDMLGNVGEWTGDWYDPKYYAHSVERDPEGPESGDRKVIRGNVLVDATGNPVISDTFSRNFLPVTWSNRAGFRLAHSLL